MKNFIQTLLILFASSWSLLGGPLKVYIMAGQSNMQGHAEQSTLPHMAADPKTKPLHDKFLDEKGEPRVYPEIYVAGFSENGKQQQRKQGPLSIGYGKSLFFTNKNSFGPELGFGITMYERLNEPILIIKTAWGGKSLHTDYRPPSANFEGLPESDIAGNYYRLMMKCIKEVLNDPKKFCSAFDPKEGFELSGFVWFQGWNDYVDRKVYPDIGKPDRFDLYSNLLGNFIRDIRKELSAPKLPFVIGVLGVDGTVEDVKNGRHGIDSVAFREAMAAPSRWSEFEGNVFSVRTGEYWDFDVAKLDFLNFKNVRRLREEYIQQKGHISKVPGHEKKAYWEGQYRYIREELAKLLAKELPNKDTQLIALARSNGAYHYLGCGKIIGQIGEAFGKAMPTKTK